MRLIDFTDEEKEELKEADPLVQIYFENADKFLYSEDDLEDIFDDDQEEIEKESE